MSAGTAGAIAAVQSMLRIPRAGARWSVARWIVAGVLTLGVAPAAKIFGRLWTWLAVMTAIGLGVGAVRLFGVLGLELAVALGIPVGIMSLDVGAAIARELQRNVRPPGYAGRTLLAGVLVSVGVVVVLALPPALISAVRGIWVPTCDWWFGIKAYALMPLTTAVLGAATGHAVGVIVGMPRGTRVRRALAAVAPFLPALLVAIAALWRFYSAPPVFTYNALLGFFPGNMYDEHIPLGETLLWSRLEQLAWVTALLAVVARRIDVPTYRATLAPRPHARPLIALVLAVGATAGGITLRMHSGELGYAVDSEDIEEALGGRIETPHFIIHYAQTPDIDQQIGIIAADHEFRFAQVTQRLGVTSTTKIRTFYFANADQKARWTGARDVEMAKPWRREIYLEHRPFPHGSLRHEIAHAVAADFGDPYFGVAAKRVAGLPVFFQPGLIEGLAVAADWPAGYDRLTPHESVRVLQELGRQPEIRSLLTMQFFSLSSATSYTTAGSFLRYLLDTYGAEPLRAVYSSGGDFGAAYGKPLAVLENDWRTMISAIVLPPGVIEATKERFRVGSVFSRPCPHAIADRRDRAGEAWARGEKAHAITQLRSVCVDAPDEPRYRLELADYLGGGSDADKAEARIMWTSLATDSENITSSLRGDAIERLARIASERGDATELRTLLALGTSLPLSDGERRQLVAMQQALDDTGPAGTALRGYFFPPKGAGLPAIAWATLAMMAEPENGFPWYLLGLQYIGTGDLELAANALSRSLALGLPGRAFNKNAARRLATAAYRTGNVDGVRAAITALRSPTLTLSDRLLADDWEARLAFDLKRPTP